MNIYVVFEDKFVEAFIKKNIGPLSSLEGDGCLHIPT